MRNIELLRNCIASAVWTLVPLNICCYDLGMKYRVSLTPLFFIFGLYLFVIAILSYHSTGFWIKVYGFYFLFFALGVCMCLHRLVSHNAAQVPLWILYPLAFLGSMVHVGTPLEWLLGHNLHHQNADKVSDPIRPTLKGFNHILGYFSKMSEIEVTKILLRNQSHFVMKSRFLISLSRWYYLYFIGFIVSVYIIFNPTWSLPILLGIFFSLVSTSVLTHWGHVRFLGYRNHNLPDQSTNLVAQTLWFFGEEIHNNHHADPKNASNHQKWWELDIIGFLLNRFKSWV